MGAAPSPSPSWLAPAGLFVVVSAVIFGLALWQPFDPAGEPAADSGLAGDPGAGEVLYADGCAGCHGAGGEGGAGPALEGRELAEAAVAGVIANGRGTMPAGIFVDQDAQDVAAFVAQLSGGAAVAAPADGQEPAVTDDPGPEPAVAGRARLFGDNLWGLAVTLDAPAPTDWTVWVDGAAGRDVAGTIPSGADGLSEPNVGPPPIIDAYERVLVGADAAAPALSATIPPEEADRMRRLSNAHPDTPGGVALLDGAGEQIDILEEHTRFLAQGFAENNVANVRLHSEHLVNIAEGEPLEELDGDGTPTNPGDGFGLTGDGYLSLITDDGGPSAGDAVIELTASIEATVADARICAAAGSIADSTDCATAISDRSAEILAGWDAVAASVAENLAVDLVEASP